VKVHISNDTKELIDCINNLKGEERLAFDREEAVLRLMKKQARYDVYQMVHIKRLLDIIKVITDQVELETQ